MRIETFLRKLQVAEIHSLKIWDYIIFASFNLIKWFIHCGSFTLRIIVRSALFNRICLYILRSVCLFIQSESQSSLFFPRLHKYLGYADSKRLICVKLLHLLLVQHYEHEIQHFTFAWFTSGLSIYKKARFINSFQT